MRIVLNEMKKIFSLKMISLLIIISLIIYYLFISFYIQYFPNGRPELDIYNVSVEMIENYGEYMDEDEFKDFKVKYNEKVKEADKYIKSNERFKKAGITTYKEFEYTDTMNDKTSTKLQELHDYILFEQKVDLFWEIPEREDIIKSYEEKEENMLKKYEPMDEKQEIRVKELLKKGSDESILPSLVFGNYNNLIKNVCMLILISIMFIISLIYIKDRKNKVNYLQYTSKIGRKIFKNKIIAGLLSSFIITTLQLIVFFVVYSFNNVSMFFNSDINSVFNSNISWYDITFIQYIIITIVAVYILSFIFALMSMFVSSIANNYIALVGIQLPIALVTFKLFLRRLIVLIVDIEVSQILLPLCYVALIFTFVTIMIIRWRREKTLDVVN
ncbi:cation transport ATPase [Gottschalkia purinilytica]|uniref:Cation transport ATPase n=1 Tax=Gottschalkia purinilytica TaxID=1503 RepID=A0A0L0WA95_GOTPU|nr:ABC transporter permease [Gottschalkia purinilytica]KNF08406.1 cation transport ATPase [Gottschalkia purinilytica]